jgi:PAS domain S-box-containing protein
VIECAAPVVIAGVPWAQELTAAVRSRRELASVHILVAAALDAPHELHAALEAGADDVVRVPFEPEVLAARVAAGLRAAQLRANEALLRSMVINIPGALYRCACDADWTMEWISDEIEEISGYPASDFINNSVRTFASAIHPDDRDQVERSVMEGVEAGRPFTLEYRIVRRDGDVRWVLERGQGQEAGDGRRWLDGAIFDITARRAAEQALREQEVVEAQLAEVRASRARILEAADRARREIERNLHDGAQQRFVSVALQLQLWLTAHAHLDGAARSQLERVLAELRTGLAELRDLAHGLHPAVLTDRGLEQALTGLSHVSAVPFDLDVALPPERSSISVEAAAYFTVCEALTNVAKYAQATRAWVEVKHHRGELHVEVRDDGVGGADAAAGSGLQGLRDRVAAVNGELDVASPPGAGTTVRARLPLDAGAVVQRG